MKQQTVLLLVLRRKARVISEKERNIVAYHESGHTVIGLVLDEADMVHKVTIVPRGQAGGYAVMLPKEDRYFMTKPELIDKITGLIRWSCSGRNYFW